MRDCENLPEDFIFELHTKIGANVQRIRKEKGISQLKLFLCDGV